MKTVFVGLSGGVDSAVAAYLLQKEGYRVVGAFIKGWEPDFLPCTGKEDRLSAMRVAAHLQIPFVTYDLEEEYKREVVDYFIEEYRAGRTPNPDVICNRAIKFGSFWKKAKADGADFIATGHYVQADRHTLLVSKDKEKDQTYFLWTLTEDDLAHSLFPVGRYEKSEIRALAEKAGLPNAKRKDSQGLCFLGHVDMQAFLKRYIPEKKGPVLDEAGKEVGTHHGAHLFTLGQRFPLPESEKRLYVVGKDIRANTLTLSENPLPETAAKEYALTRQSWIKGSPPEGKVFARYRYRQPLLSAEVKGEKVFFASPQLIASGQSCVIYSDTGEVLGGGIIG